jgi:hypothetical protein
LPPLSQQRGQAPLPDLFYLAALILIFAINSSVFAQTQTFNAQGVSIEFTATPAHAGAQKVVTGEEAIVRFRITGSNGGVPLTKLRPIAWLDQRQTKEATSARECREKV